MFIQTETTPNPATLKFLPGRDVLGQGAADFKSADDAAQRSPLASKLFGVEGVTGVFLGGDFVTVTKADDKDWHLLKPSLLGAIMEHFTSGAAALSADAGAAHGTGDGENVEIVAQIVELLDTRVRPAGAQDGIVYLHMQGSCSGCPSSTATLKMGIENMLRHYIPEIVEVRAA